MKKIEKVIVIFLLLFFIENVVYAKYFYNFEKVIVSLSRSNVIPICNVNYSTTEPTNQNVIVTITSDKEIEQVSGFILSEDKKILTREVIQNESKKVIIRDLSGNYTDISYVVNNIDKEPPQIIGCEDGKTYKAPFKIDYLDNNEIKDISVEKYDKELKIESLDIENEELCETEKSNIIVNVKAHSLDTKNYKYYLNDELYSTSKEEEYIFSGLENDVEYIVKVQALDEEGEILDEKSIKTKPIFFEPDNSKKEDNRNKLYEIKESGNYKIKVTDLAGNETVYYIKVK